MEAEAGPQALLGSNEELLPIAMAEVRCPSLEVCRHRYMISDLEADGAPDQG